jgi:phosphatidylglycerol:prolipoprotein diacylglycerol transferase
MRQTLFRINFAELWSLEPLAGVTGIGAGYFLVAGLVVWALVLLYERRTGRGSDVPFGVRLIPPAIVTAIIFALSLRTPSFLSEGMPVFGYGAMVFLGFVAAGWSAMRRAKTVGIEPEVIWDLITWIFIAGIGGARLFYVVQKQYETGAVFAGVSGPGEFLFRLVNLTDGGLVLLGGVLAVVAAVIVFCRRRGLPPLRMGDVIVPSFFIGLGFGRLGCLMNGCCFGDRCTLPWAIHFPQQSAAWSLLFDRGFLGPEATTTYGLHPTQIYSSITAFLLAWLTALYFRRRPFDGAVLALGMLLYASKRFVVELLRGDELGQFGTMFTISQWMSAAIFVSGLILMAWLTMRHGRLRQTRLAPAARPGRT